MCAKASTNHLEIIVVIFAKLVISKDAFLTRERNSVLVDKYTVQLFYCLKQHIYTRYECENIYARKIIVPISFWYWVFGQVRGCNRDPIHARANTAPQVLSVEIPILIEYIIVSISSFSKLLN